MTPAERDTLLQIRDMAEAHKPSPHLRGAPALCAQAMAYITERLDDLLAEPDVDRPRPVLIHRCGGAGHHWVAEEYADRCPICRRPTFDGHTPYSDHTDCQPCAAGGL